MDFADRLIHNRAPRRILLYTLLLALAAAAVSWLLSGMLADQLIWSQLAAVMPPGEAAREFGWSAEMSPALLPETGTVRRMLFRYLTGGMWAALLLHGGLSLLEVGHSLRQMEAVRMDCKALSAQKMPQIPLRGEPSGSVFRICESVNLVAVRMQSLTERLEAEKSYVHTFLTDFSHQIKNALAAVRLSSDLLTQSDALSPAQRDALGEELDEQLTEMGSLVHAALKLARLDADAVLYEMQTRSLGATCAEAVRRMETMLRQSGIAVALETDENDAITHDPSWMAEAVGNILTNAVLHAGCTRILVRTERLPGAVRLTIEDNGRGIPQNEIPRLFERFSQKRSGTTLRSTGIGLAIAERIFARSSGSISVFSEPGCTRFETMFLLGNAGIPKSS